MPMDENSPLRDEPIMTGRGKTNRIDIERLETLLSVHQLSDYAASKAAVGNRYLMQSIRRGRMPSAEAVARLAKLLGTHSAYLMGLSNEIKPSERAASQDAFRSPDSDFLQPAWPRDVPVFGTTAGSRSAGDVDSDIITIHDGDIIDYFRRPPGISNRRDVYALYVNGSSMEPRFMQGDPVFVDPKRPARPGDDVVIQIVDQQNTIKGSLIKRLIKQTATSITVAQFNPPAEFQIPVDRIAINGLHRVIPIAELLTI
jgi:phage repressor protein C with HTH and peptisase S24 domain